jgi:chitodextrinase
LTGRRGIAVAVLIAGFGLSGCGGTETESADGDSQTTRTISSDPPAVDRTPPTTPAGLTGAAVSPTQINLNWLEARDNVEVTGYRIYRGGVLLTTLGSVTTFQHTGLTPSTTYSYTVQAIDGAGNPSGQSPAALVTTPATLDTTAPSTPTGLTANAVSNSRINLSWTASTDDVAVTGYGIFRNGGLLITLGNVTSYQDSFLLPATTYIYTVLAFDAAGNISGLSGAASATTSATLDTIPPTAPAFLSANAVSPSQINLNWQASTDNDAIAVYRVYRNGAFLVTLAPTTAYQDVGLSTLATYSYNVDAVDAAGNVSGLSPAASATTLAAPDTAAPSTPTGLSASAVSPFQINLAWSGSSDNTDVTGYRLFRNGVFLLALGNVTAYQNTGLAPSTSYSYAVQAVDAAGNLSGLSTTAVAMTQAGSDTVAPSTPAGLAATAISSTQIRLNWSPSTDNVGVTGYRVYRGGVFLGAVGNVTTTQTAGLTPSTTYTYRIDAIDAVGNASGISAAASATTPAAGSSVGGRIFYDGFDDGTTNKWNQDDFRNRCQVVTSAADGGPGPIGTYMVRCNWNGSVAWNAPARFETLTIDTNLYDDELFIRVRTRLDVNHSVQVKLLRIFHDQGGVKHDLFGATGPGGSGINNAAALTSGNLPTYWGSAPGDSTRDDRTTWHKIEYYVRQSTGTIKVWHDGILVRHDTGYNFEGVKWSPFYITSNAADPFDATNYIYFDEFEVYSDRGTGASGTMSDATIAQ